MLLPSTRPLGALVPPLRAHPDRPLHRSVLGKVADGGLWVGFGDSDEVLCEGGGGGGAVLGDGAHQVGEVDGGEGLGGEAFAGAECDELLELLFSLGCLGEGEG